ncbi:MAG TPA: TIM barrel protein [Terriglobia bacterium]|nr:TIM barrel protein [Terriglobia bacterium]
MSRIPLACSDFSFPLLPHDLALDLIAGMGFEGVDVSLMVGNSHLPVEKVFTDPSPWGRDVRAKVEARGLKIADVNFTPGRGFSERALNHPEARVRRESSERFRRALEFSAGCKARHMTLLPGIPWEGEPKQSSLQRSAEELAWRVEEASKAGVTVSVEPHLGSIIPTPQETRSLLQLTPGLTLTLDYTHFVYEGIQESECEGLLPHASHFHARGGCRGRLQAPRKENTIDYARVLQKMQEVGYPGYFAIEYVWIEWERCNEVDNVSETVLLRDLANQFR